MSTAIRRRAITVIRVSGLVALIVCASESSSATQDASGTLAGRVIDAVSLLPIAGATVSIMQVSAAPIGPDALAARALQGRPPAIVSANDGTFLVSDVAAGSFSLRARKAGYIGGYFGQAAPAADETIQQFDLRPGERARGIVLRLWKASSVVGRVLSSTLEPVVGQWVQALRIDTAGPRLELHHDPPVASDARGEYRIGDLPPGRYLVQVSASAPPSSVADLYARLTPRSPQATIHATDAPVYYPDALSPSGARVVTLGPGEDATAIEVTLPASPSITSISGRIVGLPAGTVDCRVRLLISGPTQPLGDGFELTTTDARPDGFFTFAHVPVGTYVVRGLAWQGDWWFSQTVAVGETPVTGLELRAAPGTRITGRIFSDDDLVEFTANELRALQVFVRPLDGWNFEGQKPFQVDADGTFASPSLPAGRFLLSFGSQAYPSKVLVGGLDVRDKGFEVSGADLNGVLIRLRHKALRISGTVVDNKATPRPDAYIVYFPADPQSWNEWTVRRTRPSRSGTYAVDVAPGKYLLAAIEGGLPDAWREAAFLSKLMTGAVKLDVDKTSVAGQELRITAVSR